MVPAWGVTTTAGLIEDGVLVIGDGYRAKNSELGGEGIPFARGANVNSGFDFRGADLVPRSTLARVGVKRSQPGDVVFTSKGTVGRFARVAADTPEFVYSPQLCFWRSMKPEVLDGLFLYYWIQGPESMTQIHALKGQTDMADYVSLGDQRRMTISIPPVAEQRRIASVLGALDDKIESNKRRCALHAEMIDAMFSHHIIAGRELGDVEGDLTSIARFVNGGAFTKRATGTGRPVLRIKELNSGISNATVFNDLKVKEENIARHHDLLFSWSGSLDVYRWHGPEALINQHIFKVVLLDGFPIWFVEGWIRRHLREFQGIAQDKATTMGHIKREHLTQAKVRIPPREVLAALDEVLAPLDEQIGAVARETRTLRALRDELLPKLVSGELRVALDTGDGDEPREFAA